MLDVTVVVLTGRLRVHDAAHRAHRAVARRLLRADAQHSVRAHPLRASVAQSAQRLRGAHRRRRQVGDALVQSCPWH